MLNKSTLIILFDLMGAITYIVGIVIIAVFIYLVVTNPSFLSYAFNAVKGINTTIPSDAQFVGLFNKTRNMSEGTFVNWSINNSASNPVISKIKAASANVTAFKNNLESFWQEYQSLRNLSSSAGNYSSTVYNSLKSKYNNVTSNSSK